MPKVGSITKQPRESLAFSVSYDEALQNATPTSLSVQASSAPEGLTIGSTNTNGSTYQAVVSGGVDQMTYTITLLATVVVAGITQVFEDEIRVRVKEVI